MVGIYCKHRAARESVCVCGGHRKAKERYGKVKRNGGEKRNEIKTAAQRDG